MLPTKFRFIWPGGFGEEDFFRNWPTRNKNCLWQPCLSMDWDGISNLYRGPSVDASYLSFGSFGEAVSEMKIFRNRQIWNKNCLWRPCLQTDWNEMSKLYREPSIDASYQVLVHLAMRFQRKIFFRNRPIRIKNYLWQPCLSMDQNEMSNFYRGPSIHASYQVVVCLAKWFQRRRIF